MSLIQIIKKRCDTVQKKYGQSGWHHQIHSKYLQTQALVSLIKSISNLVYATTNPENKLQATPNAVDQTIDLLLSRPANTSEKQPITHLKPRISANPTDTRERVKIFYVFLLFYSN